MTRFLQRHTTIRTFLTGDSGAVTVDWVVLTAAITGLGLASAAAVRTGTSALGSDVSSSLSNTQVASLSCMGDNNGPDGFECYTGPTIASIGQTYYMASMPMCYMTSEGGGYCEPSRMYEVTEYSMSDGSTYTRSTETVGNEDPVITWTDRRGNAVDEPPPYEGSEISNSGCWQTREGYTVCS